MDNIKYILLYYNCILGYYVTNRNINTDYFSFIIYSIFNSLYLCKF